MANKPPPKAGLIVKYDYLWKNQKARGWEQGGKDRPCGLIVALKGEKKGAPTVLLCPITHTKPEDDSHAVKIPAGAARQMGLDQEQSWITTNEYNTVKWDDPGLLPASKKQWEYGMMPEAFYEKVRQGVLAHTQERTITRIDRTADKKRADKIRGHLNQQQNDRDRGKSR